MEKGAGLRPRRAWREDSDSDRDATDDPAPKVPVEEETPLPDTEIPGAYPKMLGFLFIYLYVYINLRGISTSGLSNVVNAWSPFMVNSREL